ncbi:MAG: hypothetical protein HY077_08475 [Elusimicrobia bacterium]|nr:hypothetical protein [Elusimicrobiota bacterium]
MHKCRSILAVAAVVVATAAVGILAAETQNFEQTVKSTLSKDNSLFSQSSTLKASVSQNASVMKDAVEAEAIEQKAAEDAQYTPEGAAQFTEEDASVEMDRGGPHGGHPGGHPGGPGRPGPGHPGNPGHPGGGHRGPDRDHGRHGDGRRGPDRRPPGHHYPHNDWGRWHGHHGWGGYWGPRGYYWGWGPYGYPLWWGWTIWYPAYGSCWAHYERQYSACLGAASSEYNFCVSECYGNGECVAQCGTNLSYARLGCEEERRSNERWYCR